MVQVKVCEQFDWIFEAPGVFFRLPAMSVAVYYSRLEGMVRGRIGDRDASTISTAEIANGLSTTLEEAVHIYEAYNRHARRQYEFEKQSAPFENRHYHRLIVHRVASRKTKP
jgi:hypothetical protein